MAGFKKETQLNEKDSLQDMLNIEKDLVKLYAMAMTESNNKLLRNLIKTSWNEAAIDQFDVFKEMNSHGYYELKPADKTQIDQKKADFKEIKQQLGG